MPSLHALAGPLAGAAFRLDREEVTVGRQASCHICVVDPSVSRQHCSIFPDGAQWRIRDLVSNNGTFVNGDRVIERVLGDGDKIRIGDTAFRFAVRSEVVTEHLDLADNGVATLTNVERGVSGSAETAIQSLFEAIGRGNEFSGWGKAFLRIGAALNTGLEIDALQIDLLKLILEVVPAEQSAMVLLPAHAGGKPTITGWDSRCGQAGPVLVSRTLVTRATEDLVATFSDDVAAHHALGNLTSLANRQVRSVIVVPLFAEEKAIGAMYLDSADPTNRLRLEHFEFASIIGEYAGAALARTIRLTILRDENRRLQSLLHLDHNLIGCSQAMQHTITRISRIARTDATVLIRGETGTGKELAARAIHQNSTRAARPFEAINCALLRDTLLESELFGHEKGSFTGAITQKKGKLELADGGTVFLDELAELGPAAQAMLLRVLQTREFQRLGGSRTLRADVRIIAATNANLEEAVNLKSFREDLYYRLNVVSMTMAPLRERREDITLLADHFLQVYSRKNKRLVTKISPEAMSLLVQHDWPGNIRELENAIEHAVVFGMEDEVFPEDLPDALLGSPSVSATSSMRYHEAVSEAKRNIVRSALARASGNYTEAARLLGIHVNNLHRLMRELKLKPVADGNRPVTANAETVTLD